jgi:hypothetical protein
MTGIIGAHFLIYSKDADADRAFLRDVLGFQSVDAGEGWLIFALPPSEVAVHPSDGTITQNHAGHDMLGVVLYLMCDDVRDAVTSLGFKNVTCAPVETAAWGLYTVVRLPSGGSIGLYQPTHPTAVAAAH